MNAREREARAAPDTPPVRYLDHPGPPGWRADRALVLIHGLGGRRQHYDAVIPPLGRHVRTIALDLPGFGASALPPVELSLDDHADAVAAVLADAGVVEAVIAGHSMGGPIAIRFALRHPQYPRALVLVCGTVQSFQQTLARRVRPWIRAPRTAIATVAELLMAALRLPAGAARALAGSRLGRRLALWAFVHRPAELDPSLALIVIAGAGTPGVLPSARAIARIAGWEHSDPGPLPPLYAINGTFDRIAPIADLRRFPIPLRRAVTLPTGHMVMLEAPGRFVDELLAVLRQTWP